MNKLIRKIGMKSLTTKNHFQFLKKGDLIYVFNRENKLEYISVIVKKDKNVLKYYYVLNKKRNVNFYQANVDNFLCDAIICNFYKADTK